MIRSFLFLVCHRLEHEPFSTFRQRLKIYIDIVGCTAGGARVRQAGRSTGGGHDVTFDRRGESSIAL
jgi:hypothetical protein